MRPVLETTPLDKDLQALSAGLGVLRQFKYYLLDKINLKSKWDFILLLLKDIRV